jgi:hypothetical protein
MLAGWKTLDTQNNSSTIDLSQEEEEEEEEDMERPLNRLLDGYNREAETGHLLA